jgi:hypothetical protein
MTRAGHAAYVSGIEAENKRLRDECNAAWRQRATLDAETIRLRAALAAERTEHAELKRLMGDRGVSAETVRSAYREGWYVNAAVDDQPAEYLAECEEVDWQMSRARAAIEPPSDVGVIVGVSSPSAATPSDTSVT